MRPALTAILVGGLLVGACHIAPAAAVPLASVGPFFGRVGLRGLPVVEGMTLDRTALPRCADPADEARAGRQEFVLEGACRPTTALAAHDQVWLRGYLDRQRHSGHREASPVPEALVYDPVSAIDVSRLAGERGQGTSAGSRQAATVPLVVPRPEPASEPRPYAFYRVWGGAGGEQKNPYMPRRLPAGILP